MDVAVPGAETSQPGHGALSHSETLRISCSLSGILNQANGGADPEAEERSPKEKGIGTEASERRGGGSLPERKESLTLFSNKGSYLEKNQPPYNSSLNTK